MSAEQSGSSAAGDHLLRLLDKASEEISAYRHRQLNTFREAIIVQALITWGISQLKLQENASGWLIRILAGLACLYAGIIGRYIIMSYKKRIYYIRKQRESLIQHILVAKASGKIVGSFFYPIDAGSLDKEFQTRPTSSVYSFTLIVLGGLTLAVNILAGLGVIHDVGNIVTR